MKLHRNKFGPYTILIGVVIIALTSIATWIVYENLFTDDSASIPVAGKAQPASQDLPTNLDNSCPDTETVLVSFNENVLKERQLEIISAEKVTIKRELKIIGGYSLNVSKGEEQNIVDAFKLYDEVQNAECARISSAD